VLRPDCSVVVDFETTHLPRRGKVASIVKDCKNVLVRSSVVNHLHIAAIQ
jgi:hypothetical protein